MIALQEFSIARKLRPIYEINVYGLEQWCKDYETNNKYPVPVGKRFQIGLYQINQGTNWKDGGLNKYESYCAAFLHFMMVCTTMKLDYDIDWQVSNIEHIPKSYYQKEAPLLLDNISKAAQQIYYYEVAFTNMHRKSRFDKMKLSKIMGNILHQIISLVPIEYRKDGLYQASLIMTGVL
jgi:hypothetical protein